MIEKSNQKDGTSHIREQRLPTSGSDTFNVQFYVFEKE